MAAVKWIKLSNNLSSCVQVCSIEQSLGVPHEVVVLALYNLACWLNTHGTYGNLEEKFIGSVDMVGCSGLSKALLKVGWLKIENGWCMFSGFTTANTTRRSFGTALRLKIISGGCFHCGSLENLEIDHDIPVSRGGEHDESNLICLCRTCNRKKSTKTYSEFCKTEESSG